MFGTYLLHHPVYLLVPVVPECIPTSIMKLVCKEGLTLLTLGLAGCCAGSADVFEELQDFCLLLDAEKLEDLCSKLEVRFRRVGACMNMDFKRCLDGSAVLRPASGNAAGHNGHGRSGGICALRAE